MCYFLDALVENEMCGDINLNVMIHHIIIVQKV